MTSPRPPAAPRSARAASSAGSGSTRPAPRAGSSSGSTPSAAISSAWTTGSSSAGPGRTATPISRLMGDLSRNHATLIRNGEGYLLQAHQASFVNGKPVVDQAVLHDGDVIRLGSTVELEFRQPSPVSATARLSIVSRHRLPLAVDGVLLMAETCIVGAAPQAHIPAPALKNPVVLYRQAGASGAGPPAPSTWTAEPVPPAPL